MSRGSVEIDVFNRHAPRCVTMYPELFDMSGYRMLSSTAKAPLCAFKGMP